MRAFVLFALAGCNQVLGIEGTHKPTCNDDDKDYLCDEVDPCPADTGDKADADGDGVGDACDPSPTLVGDSLAQFYPMSTIDSTWSVSDGSTWLFEDSALVATDVANAATEHPAPPDIIEPTVEVVIEPVFGGDGSEVGAYVVAQPSGITLVCRVVHHDGGDELQMLIGSNLSSLTLEGTAGPLVESGPLRIYGGQLPDADHTVRCRARFDTVGVAVDIDPNLSRVLGRASFATFGLQTENASAAFDSVTVFTRQP
jgi:hypothetical protein